MLLWTKIGNDYAVVNADYLYSFELKKNSLKTYKNENVIEIVDMFPLHF